MIAVAVGFAFLLGHEASERALLAARYTARAAFVAFTLVYLIGPAAKLWPGSVFRKLVAHRRQLGLATALILAAHAIALAINIGIYRPRPVSALVPGGVIYLLLLAMVLTSSDAAQRRMGRWWRRLHLLALNALWIGFAAGYVLRLFKPDYFWVGALFAPVVVALPLIRLYASLSGRTSPRPI